MEAILESLAGFNGLAHAYRCQEILSSNENLRPELGPYTLNYCKGKNLFGIYENVHTKILKEKSFSESDAAWLKQGKEQIESNIQKKKNDININKNSKDKLLIKGFHIDLAKMYEELGNYTEAISNFTKALEWNPADTSPLDVYHHLFRTLIFSNNPQKMTTNNVRDSFADLKTDEQRMIFTSIQCAMFLKNLLTKDFPQALKILKNDINGEFLQKTEDFFTKEELSYYTALLLLNCCKRSEISELSKVENMKIIISGSPLAQELIEAALLFDYSKAVQNLHKITERIKYDPYIFNSRFLLNESIFEKLLKQFLLSFQRIKIQTVADLFGVEYSLCLELLKKLILSKQIHFLIEPLQKELIYRGPEESQKAELYKSAIKAISNYLREKHLSLLRYKMNQIMMEKGKGGKDLDQYNDMKRFLHSGK